MSMLAGPRIKQKVINLRAKNNAWSNDSQKFGQRMLEKMGWSSGKGLGAKENGIVEHVIARYKNDEKGLGFEDKNDQWTKHEDDFNSLLANLSNASDKEDKLHSGVSLEKKSKTSKARIHYHKFTRGKDLSRYSEKDLANIFGKKTLKNKDADSSEPATVKDEIKMTEQKFTEKGSMQDYFQNKLALKIKSKDKLISPVCDSTKESDYNDYSFQGFSTAPEFDSEKNTEVSFQPFSFYNNKNVSNENTEETNDTEVIKKKKKKKSKTKELSLEEAPIDTTAVDQAAEENIEEVQCKKSKKSKKRKNKAYDDDLQNEVEEKTVVNDIESAPVKKKKKKNKDK